MGGIRPEEQRESEYIDGWTNERDSKGKYKDEKKGDIDKRIKAKAKLSITKEVGVWMNGLMNETTKSHT